MFITERPPTTHPTDCNIKNKFFYSHTIMCAGMRIKSHRVVSHPEHTNGLAAEDQTVIMLRDMSVYEGQETTVDILQCITAHGDVNGCSLSTSSSSRPAPRR